MISPMMSVTRCTEATISPMVEPASATSLEPVSTFDGGADEGLDLARRLGRTLGQRADLAGDDREAAALLAGAGGLDGGIEGQDVGLKAMPSMVPMMSEILREGGVDLVHGGDDLRDHRARAGDLGGRERRAGWPGGPSRRSA